MAICPYEAISNNWLVSLTKSFNERLAEYASSIGLGRRKYELIEL